MMGHVDVDAAGRPDAPDRHGLVRIRVLGPLEVELGDERVTLRAAKWRSLLARLIVADGQVVSVDQLIDELWPDGPPRGAVNQIHGYVMRVRRALGDADGQLLRTRSPGYQLCLEPDALDAVRYERLHAEGLAALAAGDPGRAADVLREALDLWRGPAFSDVASSTAISADAQRLEEQRMATIEARVDADLALGRHAALVIELPSLVEAEPFRERRWEQLMLALYRSGRRADALDAYQRLYRRLRHELGIEPGPEVRALHQRILRSDPALDAPPPGPTGGTASGSLEDTSSRRAAPAPPVPRQLPADVMDFTGRARELQRLDAILDQTPVATGVPIGIICGMAGVGKTSLSVHWGHRVAARFPDGQLFCDLRGYALSPPREPGEVVAAFLRALGVAPERIPTDLDEAAALYRSLLADKRVLIVLDNAGSSDQVRPLLPGSASCMVLVTSRDRLAGLTASHGAVRLELDKLRPDESYTLLGRIAGEERIESERTAADQLAELCHHLPLALRLAGSNLATSPSRSVAAAVGELENADRVETIRVQSDPDDSLRAAFDLSYCRLTPDEQRMFRLLSLAPGPDIGTAGAAALANVGIGLAEALLRRLAAVHLISEHADGRYAFHDLLREYAARLAAEDETEAERTMATARLLTWYCETAAAAISTVFPHVIRLPEARTTPGLQEENTDGRKGLLGPQTTSAGDAFADRESAAAWLEAERACFVPVVRCAATMPRSDHRGAPPAWRLGDVLRSYYFFRRQPRDWITVATLACSAARADGSRAGEAAAELSLTQAYRCIGDYADARRHGLRATQLCHDVRWPAGEAVAYNELAVIEFEQGRYRAGIELQERAVVLDRVFGNTEYEIRHRMNIASAYIYLGQLAEAVRRLEDIVDRSDEDASPQLRNAALTNLAEGYWWQGRYDDARRRLEQALRIQRTARYDSAHLVTTVTLARVHADLGNLAEAAQYAESVASLAERLQSRRADGAALVLRADVAIRRDEPEQAVACASKAAELFSDGGNQLELIDAQLILGRAYVEMGDHPAALTAAQAALASARKIEARAFEGCALTLLAQIYLATGQEARATETAREALLIHRETGHRPGELRTLELGRLP